MNIAFIGLGNAGRTAFLRHLHNTRGGVRIPIENGEERRAYDVIFSIDNKYIVEFTGTNYNLLHNFNVIFSFPVFTTGEYDINAERACRTVGVRMPHIIQNEENGFDEWMRLYDTYTTGM